MFCVLCFSKISEENTFEIINIALQNLIFRLTWHNIYKKKTCSILSNDSVLFCRMWKVNVATVFTTHATMLGR